MKNELQPVAFYKGPLCVKKSKPKLHYDEIIVGLSEYTVFLP